MSGRGRPRKAMSPASMPKEIRHAPPVKRMGSEEDKQEKNKRKEKHCPQNPNHAEDKPSVEQTAKEKPIKRLTREHSKEQQMSAVSTKAKACSTRSKSVKMPPGDPLNRLLESQTATSQSVMPKEFKKASVGAAKASGTAQSKIECTKVPTKMESAKPKKKEMEREVSKKTEPAAEKSNDKVRPEKIKPKEPKAKTDSEDSVLKSVLGKLKIRAKDKADASKIVNDFIENLITYLKNHSTSFKEVDDPLRTGSYYENLKISDPDEFDIMIPMPVDRVNIQPFGEKGAFYSVALKRGTNPLQKFQQNDILSASEMLKEFRKEVKKFAKDFPGWTMTNKQEGCPAVTLTHQMGSVAISLDVVLCLKVKSSWPPFTRDGLEIDGWLGTKVKQEYKRKAYYLVPKFEGRGNVENEGVLNKDVWRVSFSHIEKDIIKKHGSEKTCCEREGESCCRKACLKLLKHLLRLLKESDPTFEKFCSYHAKTTLLRACCVRTKDSEWRGSDLNRCFSLLLQDFESHLRRSELKNFFIPSQNLLAGPAKKHCIKLADAIERERENCFPIFMTDLHNRH